jgi:hypothetical protein
LILRQLADFKSWVSLNRNVGRVAEGWGGFGGFAAKPSPDQRAEPSLRGAGVYGGDVAICCCLHSQRLSGPRQRKPTDKSFQAAL